MASKSRETIKLKSTESKDVVWTTKNRKTVQGRLELKKFDKKLRRHVIFKESK
jgi:large subunit ribosomal protein L33